MTKLDNPQSLKSLSVEPLDTDNSTVGRSPTEMERRHVGTPVDTSAPTVGPHISRGASRNGENVPNLDAGRVGAPSARVPNVPLPDASASVRPFPRMPQRRHSISYGGLISFGICVVVPTVLAAIYYLGYASNQYVVEWRFTIRDANTGTSTAQSSSALPGLLGMSGAALGPDNYMVTEYITSEQAVVDLEKRIGLRALYAKSSIDYFSRADQSLPIERFVRYWDYMVSASFDQVTGTAVAEVKAFAPEDAFLIARTLMELTEELVQEASQRPLWEAVHYAEAVVSRAQEQLKKIRVELTDYRNKATVIDPNSSIVLSNAVVTQTLRQSIAQYQSELRALLSSGLNQNSQQAESLKRRIEATQAQVKELESDVAKAKEGNQSLSEVVGRYEELDIERQFAQTFLTSAMQSLEQARSSAMAKRLFVVPYVRPIPPQSSTYPRRSVAILTIAGACLLLWTVALLLWRAIKEHLS